MTDKKTSNLLSGSIVILVALAVLGGGAILFLKPVPEARTPSDAEIADLVIQTLDENEYVARKLLENPEIVIAALDKWKAIADEKARNGLKVAPDLALEAANPDTALVIGKADAPLTLVEFFDFNCGYCRRTAPLVAELVERRPDIKIVLRQFPVITPDSRDVAAIALAADRQGLGTSFYKAATTDQHGPINREKAIEIAVKTGADRDELIRDAESTEILEQIQTDLALGQKVGVRGTPGWLQGTRHFSGFMPLDSLEAVAEGGVPTP